jgi:glycosyltransferase involved in cell wall biosynthesis
VNRAIKVLHTEWSDGWGGQEIRIINEMIAVREQGLEVFLACRSHSIIRKKALENNIQVFILPFRGNADFKTLFALKGLIKKHSIDIVNTHSGKDTWVGGLAAKFSGAKFIRTRHLSNRIRSSRTNFINELADYIFTTGESVRTDMIEYNRINPEKIQSVPTGINANIFDPNKYDKETCRKQFNLQLDEFVIGMVAVLRQFKRHDLFLQSAKRIVDQYPGKKIKFIIAGDGPRREVIKGQIKKLGLQNFVVMLGYVEVVPELLSTLDIFILTSDSKEGVPQSVIQALMMGKAVVATDAGSTKDLLDNNFILVNSKVDDISDALISLISDTKFRNTISESARKSVLNSFSIDIMVNKIMKVYNKLL